MRAVRFHLCCLCLILLLGCETKRTAPMTGVKPKVTYAAGYRPPPAPPPPLKLAGRAILKGRVTYERSAMPTVEMLQPAKDAHLCRELVQGKGWYVQEQTKGVQHMLVLLRPPAPFQLPEPEMDPKKQKHILSSVDCQYRPRLTLLKPGDKFEFHNTDRLTIDFNISGPCVITKCCPPGTVAGFQLEASDNEQHRIRSGIHHWMSTHIWQLSHPYAAVTDGAGLFEIEDVPIVVGPGEPTLWIWHEMLPGDGFREIGRIKLTRNQTAEVNIPIKD